MGAYEVPNAETITYEERQAFNRTVIAEFRANAGQISCLWEGATALLLATTGAKSGKIRLTPLAYVTIDGAIIIVGSKSGSESMPDWVFNLRANPHARIEIGTDAYDVIARELPLDERAVTYPKVAAAASVFGEYEAKTRRVIPLFELRRA